MKKTVFADYRFVPALLLAVALSGGVATAQKSSASPKLEENEVNVKIIERHGDEVRETERTYRLDGMSDPQRDKVVMKLVDSLKAAHKDGRKHQMTIIVEEADGNQIVTRERITPKRPRVPNDAYVQRNRLPQSNFNPWTDRTWGYELRRGTDSLTDQLRRFQFQIPRDFDRQLARPFEDWAHNFNGKPSTIRGLDAYPNNPDQNVLNVRFTAPAKGDVSIAVTNPKGKEIARRDIKNFSGEFVGQIDLGKKSQGACFITVTQNEDGAVKRLVLD